MSEPSVAEQILPHLNTIRGDLRDVMIGALANMTKPWDALPEAEQVQLANLIDGHAQAIVTRIAILTATAGRPTVLANLENLTINDTARGTFTVSKENASALVPYTKQIVAIMAVGPNQFMGEREKVQTMPDQPSLPIGERTLVAGVAASPKIVILRDKAGDVDVGKTAAAAETAAVLQKSREPRASSRAKPKPTGTIPPARKTGSPFQ